MLEEVQACEGEGREAGRGHKREENDVREMQHDADGDDEQGSGQGRVIRV